MLSLFSSRKKDTSSAVLSQIEAYELPSFSATVMNVLAMLRRPGVEMQPIAEELQKDPGLSVKALRLVNSVGFGLSTRVSNVQHAVVLLGRSRLECLVLSVAVSTALPGKGIPGFDLEAYWRTAALRASMAGGLAKRLHPATEIESFTAGLLQDIGVAFLADRERERYVPLYARWREDDSAMLSAQESSIFGFDHAEIGGLLARNWQLPEFLVNAIEDHHTRESEDLDEAVWLVSLIKSHDSDQDIDTVVDAALRTHGLDESLVRGIAQKARSDADQFYKALQG
ncbi:MAG: HDOD domain-containing protein [Rhodothermales bacterium]